MKLEVATLLILTAVLAFAACRNSTPAVGGSDADVHSFSRPSEVAVKHLSLDIDVNFAAKRIEGRASLTLDRRGESDQLWLDVRDLDIHGVTGDDDPAALEYALGQAKPYLGQALTIELKPETRVVHVQYASRPEAAALQWLEPEMTAGGRQPFLLSQSQAALARTWIPCQDTPAVRMTYDATVRVPPATLALMSAENPTERNAEGVYRFRMPQPVPAYLLALAVGDVEFAAISDRVGVYAEPELLEKAAWEFAQTEEMMQVTEQLYGPYLWGRYDLIVLPPSFPFGGMENPRLTFVTPTILAGDRSLVSLVAHELAHSWSGNLVTNATWNDFWLNEGFTVYLERRIMEALEGRPYSEMLALIGEQDLIGEIERIGAQHPDTHLFLDLAGRDPDDGMTDVAYEKGYLLLRMLEEHFGRERWDAFLRDYFQRYQFQSLTTAEFMGHLEQTLGLDPALEIEDWVYGPGLRPNSPKIESEAFSVVDAQRERWLAGTAPQRLVTQGWSSHEWLHFIRGMPELTHGQLAQLDDAFGFSTTGNSEVLHAFLLLAVTHEYEAVYPQLEKFLTGMGRRKFLRPLYTQLATTPQGLELARRIYEKARGGYHPVSRDSIDRIVLEAGSG